MRFFFSLLYHCDNLPQRQLEQNSFTVGEWKIEIKGLNSWITPIVEHPFTQDEALSRYSASGEVPR